MYLFNGVLTVSGIIFLITSISAISLAGYMIGRIEIKGISLGTAGVFIASLLYGMVFSGMLSQNLTFSGVDFSSNSLKIVENLGLVMFVSAVGLTAGPNFFMNLKKNFRSYILLGLVIIASAAAVCTVIYLFGRRVEQDQGQFLAMMVGLMSGALTSTPGFSAAKASVGSAYESSVTVGYGITYLFGVIGVVLFVQLMPKILKADMAEERARIHVNNSARREEREYRISLDPYGVTTISLAILLGIVAGSVKIPLTAKGLSGTTFSLTVTGGVLLTSLMIGHFGHIGSVSLQVRKSALKLVQELGLVFFLIGAGVAGGSRFVEYFKPVYFLYGAAMTVIPMIAGYLFAVKIIKLPLLNALGSITGGMTSTPALGTLIQVSGSDDIASAYAATYPIALVAVVLVIQILIVLFQ